MPTWLEGVWPSPAQVLQFHFHFPSEHAIDGSLYAGELHIVHQKVGSKGTDDLLVVGVMLEVGAESSFLAQLRFASLPAAKGDSVSISGVVDLMAFSAAFDGDSYHYMGSLTTPPCSQTAHWNVQATPAEMSQAQLDAFKALYPDPANNRPLMPLNGRFMWQNNPYCVCDEPKYKFWESNAKKAWRYDEPAWTMDDCEGLSQSPVDIVPASIAAARMGSTTISDFVDYRGLSGRSLKNTGYGVQVDGEFGTFTMDSQVFKVPAERFSLISMFKHSYEII